MRFRQKITCFCFLLILMPSFASAQEKQAEEKPLKQMQEVAPIKQEKSTPVTEWVKVENAYLDTLPEGNRELFFIMRNKYNIIRSIDVVHRDIEKAVVACGEKNEELKTPMTTRLKNWEESVFPILSEADKLLDRELQEQEAFHRSDYMHLMKMNDKAFAFSDSQTERIPVTTAQACKDLLKSMDRTEDRLVRLLQEILLPQQVIRNRMERARKLQEKAKESAAKAEAKKAVE